MADNGPGVPAETIRRSLDYSIRISDKAAYIAPTRGAMGNAFKVIWAAPFVATSIGRAMAYAQDIVHRIDIRLDRIRQQPNIRHRQRAADVKNGTFVRIHWPNSAQLLHEAEGRFLQSAEDLVAAYAAFNPHATFTINGERFDRTRESWKKWRASDPTPPAWYTPETLRQLIAAYVAADKSKTVRAFVAEFKGLSSTAKQKAIGFAGDTLADHVAEGDIDQAFVITLLERMEAATKPPKPGVLGLIGESHIAAWMAAAGVAPDSIQYKKFVGDDGLPYGIEAAFGINGDTDSSRRVATGLNWSPTLGGNPARDISGALAEARLDPHDPVTLVIHITRPRFAFADRGKTRIALSDAMAGAVRKAVRLVAKAGRKPSGKPIARTACSRSAFVRCSANPSMYPSVRPRSPL